MEDDGGNNFVVPQWWELIMHRSNEKYNNSNNSYDFAHRQKVFIAQTYLCFEKNLWNKQRTNENER